MSDSIFTLEELFERGRALLAKEAQDAIEQARIGEEKRLAYWQSYFDILEKTLHEALPAVVWPYIDLSGIDRAGYIGAAEYEPFSVFLRLPDIAPIRIAVRMELYSDLVSWANGRLREKPLRVAAIAYEKPWICEGDIVSGTLEYSWNYKDVYETNNLSFALALAESRAQEFAALEASRQAEMARLKRTLEAREQARSAPAPIVRQPTIEERLLSDLCDLIDKRAVDVLEERAS